MLRDFLATFFEARRWPATLLCLFFSHLTGASAWAGTGYFALDNAAIAVKNPAAIPLVAITRIENRLFATGVHGVIIYSDDSGKSWKQASVPVDLTLTAIYFSSPKNGWAVGHYGVILTTVDGGSTWTRVLDGTDVIAALNLTAKQAQAKPISAADTALKLRVATAFDGAGPSKPLLAVGNCGGGILAAGQQDMAMYSSDGGRTWLEWTSQIFNPAFHDIYDIVSSGQVTYLVGEGGLVLRSSAECRNFVPLPGPYSATLFGGIVRGTENLLVYGLDGGIFRSLDAGATWTVMSIPSDSVVVAAVPLSPGDELVATLGGKLFLSEDPVGRFRESPLTVPFQIAGAAMAPNGDVVFVGNGGVRVLSATSIH